LPFLLLLLLHRKVDLQTMEATSNKSIITANQKKTSYKMKNYKFLDTMRYLRLQQRKTSKLKH
jgi:hypothetical protein